MAEPTQVPLSEVAVGDQLGQDIMSGSQVLLRTGTVLNEGHIRRLRQLPLGQVAVLRKDEDSAAVVRTPVSAQALPSFRDIVAEDRPGWLADEYFSQPVPTPRILSEAEKLFAGAKHKLRQEAGLKPMVDPERDARVKKEVHAAYISSVLKKEVNLEQLSGAADNLVAAIRQNPKGYLDFTDIDQFGQYLAARAIMSSKVFHRALNGSVEVDLSDQVRCQLALTNAFALLPSDLTMESAADQEEHRTQFSEALLRYYGWLRSQRFVSERTLELVLLQQERYDGGGVPYGLRGEMLPPESEAWAVASAFTSQLYSQPKRPRQGSREAADHIIALSGKAFSSRAVNRFLNSFGYFPNGSLVELNDDRLALVVQQNPTALLKPVVRVVGMDQSVGEQIDLQQSQNMFIRRQVMEY